MPHLSEANPDAVPQCQHSWTLTGQRYSHWKDTKYPEGVSSYYKVCLKCGETHGLPIADSRGDVFRHCVSCYNDDCKTNGSCELQMQSFEALLSWVDKISPETELMRHVPLSSEFSFRRKCRRD